jgi:hypothetical protein
MPVKTAVRNADQPEPQLPPAGLRLASRCDANASGAEQAFVIFSRKDGSTIELCCHHANALEASLIGQGFQAAEDRRSEVNKNPESGD